MITLCGSVGLAGVDKPPVGVCAPLLLPLPPRVGLSGVAAGLLLELLFALLLLLLLLLLPPPHSAFVTRSITEVLPLLPPPDDVADCVEADEDELELPPLP